MSNKVLLKKSSVASKIPLPADLDYGELALNYADGLLYYKDSTNTIKTLGGASGALNSTTIGLTTPAAGTFTTLIADKITSKTLPLVLNDISNQFDGYKSVFNLNQDQTAITSSSIIDSKNLEVIVNGKRLSPYVKQLTYPWLTPYDSYNGFRVVVTATSAYVIIYNTPDPGDSATLTIINSSLTAQTRKYPYSATTVALGD